MSSCRAYTAAHTRCSRAAVAGSDYCWQHARGSGSSVPQQGAPWLTEAIQRHGGPGGLDLSHADLSGLAADESVLGPLWTAWTSDASNPPALWATERLHGLGLNLIGADLGHATLVSARLPKARMQLSRQAHADLYGADLHDADMYRSDLRGASLYKADLRRAKLERATLVGADLRATDLQGANLLRANLDGALLHRQSIGPRLLQEDEEAYRTYLADDRRIEDFSLATSARPSRDRTHIYPLYGATWTPLAVEEEIARDHLNCRLLEARDIFASLRVCFAQQGRAEDASWAHLNERRVQRRSYWPPEARRCYGTAWGPPGPAAGPVLHRWWASSRFMVSWLREVVYEFSCGYGERPLRAVMSMVATAVAYAGLFVAWGRFKDVGTEMGWVDGLLVSAGAIVSTPVGPSADDRLTDLLMVSEAAIGLALFALIIFGLGSRMAKG